MSIDLKELKLPALSEAGLQVLELLASDDIDFNYLGDFLAKDPLLSATMLKYVNSPVYKREVKISNVRTAISILGLKTCKMAVSFAIMKSYDDPPTPITEKIWAHSVNVSVAARVIAENLFPELVDDVETTALMHDMGALILARSYPDLYHTVFEQAMSQTSPLSDNERAVFGVSHDDVFHVVAEHLRMCETTQKVVESFHNGETVTAAENEIEKQRLILSLAHYFLRKYDTLGSFMEKLPNDIDSLALLLNLSDDKLDRLYDECEMMLDVI